MGTAEIIAWIATVLALIVSLLTMFNAAKLKTGILAISTYAFGGGMLFLAGSFLLTALPLTVEPDLAELVSRILFLVGFVLLGFGSYKIYTMSQIK